MNNKIVKWAFFLLLTAPCAQAQSVWDTNHLKQVKESIKEPYYATTFEALRAEADRLLEMEPVSVMMKDKTPASGNKHDYMSQARYAWPDPSKPDGRPYITRDGVSNPEINRLDRNRLGEMAGRVTRLTLAWYFSDEERYAQKATELIRTWFLNKETLMNPNLEYAQVVPGENNDKGRSYGLIDTYSFVEMLDAVALLEQSASFTKKDSKQLKKWFTQLTDWMLTSKQGKEESANANNHSVAYDVQIVAFALYTGNEKLARQVVETFPEKRIFKQVDPDGKQPQELWRTLAFHYSQYNLTHYIDLMLMGKKMGFSIDNATSSDGRNFYKALDYLAQYAGKDVSQWPYKQISGWEGSQQNLYKDLYRAVTYLGNGNSDKRAKEYKNAYDSYRRWDACDLFNLTYVKATDVDHAYAFAAGQLKVAMACADKARKEKDNAAARRVIPRSINKDGSLAIVHPHDWCSGFFAGSLWQMYSYTHDDFWRQSAISWTWPIEESKWHRGTHDLGFMMYDSFGKGYELTGERSYRDVVIQSAKTLITRFSPKVKSIRSWDHNADKWKFPVIIDNMMNLEMLFRATQITGDSAYWKVAVTHANTTLKNHFREDYSSYHVMDYDPETGAVRMKCTAQGNSDDSYWSRGQGWGLYGYTMCYRFTHDPVYLNQSRKIAQFLLSLPNMPGDGVPYWDMKMAEVNNCTPEKVNIEVPRDASSAALIASALYELSTYVPAEEAARYRAVADKITTSLCHHYQAEPGSHYGFLLLHSTGHHPGDSEIDVPLNYADYYYLEAMARRRTINEN